MIPAFHAPCIEPGSAGLQPCSCPVSILKGMVKVCDIIFLPEALFSADFIIEYKNSRTMAYKQEHLSTFS